MFWAALKQLLRALIRASRSFIDFDAHLKSLIHFLKQQERFFLAKTHSVFSWALLGFLVLLLFLLVDGN